MSPAVSRILVVLSVLLVLSAGSSLAASSTSSEEDDSSSSTAFTDQWAVHISGGDEVADAIAARHGFTNLGKVMIEHSAQPNLFPGEKWISKKEKKQKKQNREGKEIGNISRRAVFIYFETKLNSLAAVGADREKRSCVCVCVWTFFSVPIGKKR